MKKAILMISILLAGCEPRLPVEVEIPGASCIKSGKAKKSMFHGRETISAEFLCKNEHASLHFYDTGEVFGLQSSALYMFARAIERSFSCDLQEELPLEFSDKIFDVRERTFYQCEDGTMMLESDDHHLLTEFIFHSRNKHKQ